MRDPDHAVQILTVQRSKKSRRAGIPYQRVLPAISPATSRATNSKIATKNRI